MYLSSYFLSTCLFGYLFFKFYFLKAIILILLGKDRLMQNYNKKIYLLQYISKRAYYIFPYVPTYA